MVTINVPKIKYQELKKKARAYENVIRLVEGDVFAPPPVRSVSRIIRELKKTNRYSDNFLQSLKEGLIRSSYFHR